MLTQQIWGYYFHILLSWQKYQYLSKIGWENFSSTYRNLLSFHINLNMLSLNLGKKVFKDCFPQEITIIIKHDRVFKMAFYELYLNDNFYEKCQYLNMYSVWGDLIGTVGDVWCHSMSPVTSNRQTQQEFIFLKISIFCLLWWCFPRKLIRRFVDGDLLYFLSGWLWWLHSTKLSDATF